MLSTVMERHVRSCLGSQVGSSLSCCGLLCRVSLRQSGFVSHRSVLQCTVRAV
jgi:hypothetical protein